MHDHFEIREKRLEGKVRGKGDLPSNRKENTTRRNWKFETTRFSNSHAPTRGYQAKVGRFAPI
jgi:hypothetical protein